jgi:hypothetical protein
MKKTTFGAIARFVLLGAGALLLLSLQVRSSQAEPGATSRVLLPLIFKNYAPSGTGYGTVAGTVTDARTGQKLLDVQVCVSDTGQCDTTDEYGYYSISAVPNGDHLINFTYPAYIDSGLQVTVLPDATVTADIALYPVLESDQYRVVLTWDTHSSWYCSPNNCPNDLNLHLWIVDGQTFDVVEHIAFPDDLGNCDNVQEAWPHACYENNEAYGSGPDVLVFRGMQYRIYSIAVLNYYEGRPNVPGLKDLDHRGIPAQVDIYRGSGTDPTLQKTITTATPGSGDLWYVAKVDVDIYSEDCLSTYLGEDTPPDECPEP